MRKVFFNSHVRRASTVSSSLSWVTGGFLAFEAALDHLTHRICLRLAAGPSVPGRSLNPSPAAFQESDRDIRIGVSQVSPGRVMPAEHIVS